MLVLAWTLIHRFQPLSKHILAFGTTSLLLFCGWALSLLENRRFLAIKIFFAIAVFLDFWYFNIDSVGSHSVNAACFFAVFLVATGLRQYQADWGHARPPWLPAFPDPSAFPR
jgi:hypothetical protein